MPRDPSGVSICRNTKSWIFRRSRTRQSYFAQVIESTPACRPVTASQSLQSFFNDFRSCSHVLKRVNSIWQPQKQSCTGMYKVIRCIGEWTFVIDFNGQKCACSFDDQAQQMFWCQLSHRNQFARSLIFNSLLQHLSLQSLTYLQAKVTWNSEWSSIGKIRW